MSRAVPKLLGGHHIQLLEGSRALFPAMTEAIAAAQTEVRLETYIFDFSGAGAELAHALEQASRRGVAVHVLVDGLGTEPLPGPWRMRFSLAGVQWEEYARPGGLGLLWPGHWRRLHRKLCVVDGTVGFCGGINVLDDFHDPNHGALEHPRFDFAVRVTGPLVSDMHAALLGQWVRVMRASSLARARLTGALVSWRASRTSGFAEPASPAGEGAGQTRAALLLRDNFANRASIEKAYLRAIGQAREEIVIANAYFVPGGKLRRALVKAARRGVRVCLLVQGRYEYFMQYYAARPVFGALLHAGVHVYEYSPSFLHAKVAVIDGRWATVGSSNLDPLSLLLAREANIVVEDTGFADELRARLLGAMDSEGRAMDSAEYEARPPVQRIKEWLAHALMRLALFVQGQKYL